MESTISPLAPQSYPSLPPVAGVSFATKCCEVRYKGRDDVLLAVFQKGTAAAGVFTKSKTASAPVEWCREALQHGQARALLVNAGNANAFTGAAGYAAMKRCVDAVAAEIGCADTDVFTASTGTIGEVLPDEKIRANLKDLHSTLQADNWENAAKAIMTTDTFHKVATAQLEIDGTIVTINGIAKGSGMIAPDMATMLSYVVTDAAIATPVLQKMLEVACNISFNAITVDSDTSTSDSLMLFATGAASHNDIMDYDDPRAQAFQAVLNDLLIDLAHQVVKDGEGATKFVEITVDGAENDAAAKVIALAIANSPLVKTAIAGEDANWGRIVMAVGKSGELADRDKMSVSVGGVTIAEKGGPVAGYDETPVATHMKGQNIVIHTDVGIGTGTATVWTCDLTHGYISINADYRS
jgi:glutamate N-acetyltransferase/amino-acid N-acetyltransferase